MFSQGKKSKWSQEDAELKSKPIKLISLLLHFEFVKKKLNLFFWGYIYYVTKIA